MTYIDKNQKSYSVSRLGGPRGEIKQNDVPVRLTVTKTGQTKDIHGYTASEVVMTAEVYHVVSGQDDRKVQIEVEIWASPGAPGSQEWRAFYEKDGRHRWGTGASCWPAVSYYRPVRAFFFGVDTDSSDFSTAGIPDSVFAVPAGYIETH